MNDKMTMTMEQMLEKLDLPTNDILEMCNMLEEENDETLRDDLDKCIASKMDFMARRILVVATMREKSNGDEQLIIWEQALYEDFMDLYIMNPFNDYFSELVYMVADRRY